MKFYATKESDNYGKPKLNIPPAYREQFDKLLRRMRNGTRVDVEIKRHVKSRSEQTHRYYFACLGEVADFTGMDIAELHEYFKARFLQDYSTGCEIPRIKSTKELDQHEMNEYLEKIRQFCMETLGFVWPDDQQLGEQQHGGR